jgi:hypothetical protein
MYDVNETTGGFACIPGSHRYHEDLSAQFGRERTDPTRPPIDHVFVSLSETESHIRSLPRYLLTAKAGDLILFDSRVIHCNTPALVSDSPKPVLPLGELLRLVGYVCMQPRSRLPVVGSAVKNKKLALLCQIPTSHWAIEEIEDFKIQAALQTRDIFGRARDIFECSSDRKLKMCGFTDEEIELGRTCFLNLWKHLL